MSLPRCQVHEDCQEPVVVNLAPMSPSQSKWACEEGFNEFQGNPRCAITVGVGGVRCEKRASHNDSDDPKERRHRHGHTEWNYSHEEAT